MKPTRLAPIPGLLLHQWCRTPSVARVFACGQLVGKFASRQKQRLSDIAVRAAP